MCEEPTSVQTGTGREKMGAHPPQAQTAGNWLPSSSVGKPSAGEAPAPCVTVSRASASLGRDQPTPWDRASASGSFLSPRMEENCEGRKTAEEKGTAPLEREHGERRGGPCHGVSSLLSAAGALVWPRLDVRVQVPGLLLVQKGLPQLGRSTCPQRQEVIPRAMASGNTG